MSFKKECDYNDNRQFVQYFCIQFSSFSDEGLGISEKQKRGKKGISKETLYFNEENCFINVIQTLRMTKQRFDTKWFVGKR